MIDDSTMIVAQKVEGSHKKDNNKGKGGKKRRNKYLRTASIMLMSYHNIIYCCSLLFKIKDIKGTLIIK